MQGIEKEVLQSSSGDPAESEEVGGLLLGRISENEVTIEDFEPVPCEHQIDRAYHLSGRDRESLRETLQWIAEGSIKGLAVVGFYRSHVRYGLFFSEEDHKLLARYFPSADNVFLLLKAQGGELLRQFYFWSDGQLLAATARGEVAPEKPAIKPEAVRPAEEESVRQALHRSTVPVLASFDRTPARRNGILPGIAMAGLILAGTLGYSSFRARPDATREKDPANQRTRKQPEKPAVGGFVEQQVRASAPSPIPSAPPRPDEILPDQDMRVKINREPPPALSEPREEALSKDPVLTAQISTVLSNWAAALKSGDESAYVAFYAPHLASYFTKKNVSQDEVRKSVEASLLKYGRFRVCNVSAIKVTPLAADRAVAVFRKNWAASGRKQFAGEELERCLMTRESGEWKIASEQEIRLYWVRK
ncbi:MAG: hypothetical protein M3Z85_10930 [Acidobacteriota bacterium]|nr:hypothetical protein [Acidobacteriota bacterium]